MTVDDAVAAKLQEVLADLVGTRVYPDAYPESPGAAVNKGRPPFPCCVYLRAADLTPATLDGSTRSGYRRDAYTVEVWSRVRAECNRGRDLLRAAFRGANCRGRWGGAGGVFVTGARAAAFDAENMPPVSGGEDLDRAERVTLTVNWNANW